MAGHLWHLVDAAAERFGEREMLVSRQGDRCTFASFRDRALRCAAGLVEQGVHAGDVVSWILPTWVDTVVLAAALSRIGAVQNPIIAIYRDREVGFCVDETAAGLLITPTSFRDYDFAALGQRIVATRPHVRHLVVEPGSFPDGDPAVLAPFSPPRDGTATWVCYTSGTAASPKGARHTDASIGAFAAAMGACMDVTLGDRYALVFPFPHVGGIGLLFLTLLTGCTHLLDEVVDPVATVQFVADNGCTHAGTGAAFFAMYLAAQDRRGSRLFPALKACPAGGAPTPAAVRRRVAEGLGAPVISAWGLTEAPVLTSNRLGDPIEKRLATEGRPLPGVDLRTVDPTGQRCAAGVPGELVVRAPQLMLGYQNAELDAAAFDSDGYYRTGDVGVIDADGYVTITGRIKDVIIRNGENVAASEVEELLHEIPGVREAAVIGLPDEHFGEEVCAVVVGGDDVPSLERVRSALEAAGLRRQALPSRLVVRAALPRNPAGKVLKRELVAELADPSP